MKIFDYKKSGVKMYGCKGYLGLDELTGKQVNINKRGFQSRGDAELYFMKMKIDFADGVHKIKAKEYTYEDVYTQWLEVYQNTVKESTLAKTKQLFRLHILPKFADNIIARIKPDYIQKVVNEWHQSFKKYRTVYNYFELVIKYAIKQDLLQKNPCDKVTIPTKKLDYGIKKQSKDFYSREELETFLETVKEHESYNWYTMFRLFAFTGLRRGELLALTWADIDFQNDTLKVDKALAEGEKRKLIVQSPKSEASKRVIGLDNITIKTLRQWKHQQAELLIGFGYNAMNPNQLIFSNVKNNSFLNLGAPRNALARITSEYNLPMISPHGFRHTHCSLLFESGVPMKDVKERLGHSDIQVTMNVYTHVTQDSKNKSAELFQKYANF